ncbi:cytidine and dCMP deaminase domain-containing protein 1 [Clarias gariepinus]|uniref:cytidine and dCMP deaminase domain-containing protein 1 n=1 Tax=Clarias gariepinus TaxID=13013 RepID=UPI00234C8A89|nr:cytidine and dCMP deaminase domain-containing protein 1 [Clarias gariepinus]
MAATQREYRLHPGTGGHGPTANGEDDVSDMKESSTQTEGRVQGHAPRLSRLNLFTLLSLWMELFPRRESHKQDNASVQVTGLVVVQEQRILGLHCSGAALHAGQVAVIRHGSRLKGCDLYFSRKPCSTCLKMIINAGVNRISYWPADSEISLLSDRSSAASSRLQEATLDAVAAERLKSSSRPHICVLLQPLASSMLQFVEETSCNSDFLGRMAADVPDLDVQELFSRERWRSWDSFSKRFLIDDVEVHRELLGKMNLENFRTEPYFSELRQHMRDLIRILASVAASVPVLEHEYGFYETEPTASGHRTLSQDVVRHCIIQAALLAYRTEDPKVGVGTVIWAEGRLPQCDGTGNMYLVGCGYNAYPAGSEYAEFPQMDAKQEERQRRKYRYIIHAEQNALTFRSADVKEEENTMLFVTKCPCDECVPLIQGAGIKQIFTTDLDSGKDKHDISYINFNRLCGVRKFIWQKSSVVRSASEQTGPALSNGNVKNRREDDVDFQCNKRLRN